ncbi:WD repeat-containing protein 64 [Leptodactylus fuscus]
MTLWRKNKKERGGENSQEVKTKKRSERESKATTKSAAIYREKLVASTEAGQGTLQQQEEKINYSQFSEIVLSLFGHSLKAADIKAFYRKITNHPDAPTDWTELFGYFPSNENIITAHLDPENTIFYLSKKETIKHASGAGKKKRDTIQCIMKVELLDVVVTVSQKGIISLFNSQESSWFSGCDFLNQLKKVVAVTERSIVIWDYKCHDEKQNNYFCIRPVEHCLRCICTVISQDQSLQDEILVGDDAGFVSLYSISNDDLKVQDSNPIKMSDPVILDSSIFKRFRRKLHNDWVLKVKYFPELKLFASASADSDNSLVLDDVNRIKDTRSVRVLSIPKGVTAFVYCVKANMIITGGHDKVLRLWHPNSMEKPTGKLSGHLYSIADIAVNERDQHIISLSTARGFRVWDINTLALLQVFFDTEQGPCHRQINCMIFDNSHQRLITGKKNVIYDKWIYGNNVWEMETGHQIYEIKDAHGPTIEVTAAAIHRNGLHFATGAYNGSLKIWNFGNGYETNALPPKKGFSDEDQGFCQLSFLRDINNQLTVIALDLSGNIKMIQGKEDSPTLFVTMEFNEDIGVWYKMLEPVQNRLGRRTKCLPANKIIFYPKLDVGNKQQNNVKTVEISSGKHGEDPYGNDSHSKNAKSVTLFLVSGHENGHLYLWDAKGDLISKVQPYTKHPPISITALSANKSSNIILAGNREGYVIIWSFLNCKESRQQQFATLKQHLCWRAHTLKITSLCYENSTDIVVSASVDGSIRLWHASNGTYIGYFGQKRVFEFTNKKEFILPCDIMEMPVQPKPETNILRKKNYEYPLIFDHDRLAFLHWQINWSSAVIAHLCQGSQMY